jgi:protein-S-isoprenylcysteine O-methyltransferase Ste14
VKLQDWGRIAQKVRVPAGTVLGIVFLLILHPSIRSLWIGGVVALLGAAIRVWAAGHIDKGKSLAEGGPYVFTRNPLYLGSFIMAFGVLLAGQGYWLLLPFCVFYLGVYYPVMKAEERELLQRHGMRFTEYANTVPLFVPRFTSRGNVPSTFSWSRVRRNGEHRTLAALLIIGVFLTLRI